MKKRTAAIVTLFIMLCAGSLSADELFFRLIAPPKLHEEIPFHDLVLDQEGQLLPWASFDQVIGRAMGFIENCPRDADTGLPWYEQYSFFEYKDMQPAAWPHNPAGLYGMMVETLIRYYPYTGERKWIELVRGPLDHLIAESTPPDFSWPRVPYASADNTGLYQGGSHEGFEGIEPDKIGQAAVGYLRFYKLTGDRKYLDQAVHCADVLAQKIRPGDELHSPWPYRVNARSGKVLEQYTSDVLWPIVLFDELKSLGLNNSDHDKARQEAWTWLMRYPMRNNRWKGYFEDVIRDPGNLNRDQYTPGEVARYLMRHPELDPAWQEHVPAILRWIKHTLGDTRDKWHGATAIREQRFCMQVASSHTARYASLCAMWYGRSGDTKYKEEALAAFALATYLARGDGIVVFSIGDPAVWFSDGYFDYVPHFIDGMAALPEVAPADRDHLLSSTSVVTGIDYQPDRIAYRTFDERGEEIIRLTFEPKKIMADGSVLQERKKNQSDAGSGYIFDPAVKALTVYRDQAKEIVITGYEWN